MDVESPIKGWPETTPIGNDAGGPGFEVNAKVMTPGAVRGALQLCGLLSLAGIVFVFWALGQKIVPHDDTAVYFLGTVAVFLTAICVTRNVWARALLGPRVRMQFLPNQIRIKKGSKFRSYDRNLPHEFTLTYHDKFQEEADREFEEMQARKWKGKLKKLYRNSFHVTLRYAGQRVDIADVFGRDKAEALLVRLQLLDQLMDAARGASTASPYAQAGTQYGERPAAG